MVGGAPCSQLWLNGPPPLSSGVTPEREVKPVDIHMPSCVYVYVKRTNIVLDEKVVAKARKVTGITTTKAVVDFALRELVRRSEISKLLELEGDVEWVGDLHQMRKSRPLCES
jgi:Arc/MetJ family transcription regulator